MKIRLKKEKPIETYPYIEVGRGTQKDGQAIIEYKELPIYIGEFEHSTTTVDFLIISADLQGLVKKNGEYKLIGEELPEYLKLLIQLELTDKESPKVGVLLCGDLFASITKRGASGDVRGVWEAFLAHFNWVAGVAGNHDRFGSSTEKLAFNAMKNINLLHKEIVTLDGLEIGGISGIIGRGDKVNRVEEEEYLSCLGEFIKKKLDIILLHETPDYPQLQFIGNLNIRKEIDKGSDVRICCGHCYWDKPLVELDNKATIINVDSKVLILKKKL